MGSSITLAPDFVVVGYRNEDGTVSLVGARGKKEIRNVVLAVEQEYEPIDYSYPLARMSARSREYTMTANLDKFTVVQVDSPTGTYDQAVQQMFGKGARLVIPREKGWDGPPRTWMKGEIVSAAVMNTALKREDIMYDEDDDDDYTPPTRRDRIGEEMKSLNTELRRQRKLLKLLDRFGDEDQFENEAVLAADIRYADSDKTYHYAVVKAADRFYVTGGSDRRTPGPFTWEQFIIDFLGRGVEARLFWAESMKEIGKSR